MGAMCSKAPVAVGSKDASGSLNSPGSPEASARSPKSFDSFSEGGTIGGLGDKKKKRVIEAAPSLGVSSGVMSQGPDRNCMLQGNVEVQFHHSQDGEAKAQTSSRSISRSSLHNDGTLFGVFDGFGEQGKNFSQAAMDISGVIFEKLQAEMRAEPDMSNGAPKLPPISGPSVTEKEELILKRVLDQTHEDMLKSGGENAVETSGCSAVLALHEGDGRVYIASIGDCLAVHGVQSKSASGKEEHKSRVINTAHFPNLPEEKARIEKNNGKVGHWKIDVVGELGQVAVWYGDDHAKKGAHAPGVLVSRCIGFTSASELGVLHTADNHFVKIASEDFIVLGSHGLWQMVPPDEAVKYISECGGTAQEASDGLVTLAMKRWQDRWSGEDVSVQVFYPGLPDKTGKGHQACRITHSRITSSKIQEGKWS